MNAISHTVKTRLLTATLMVLIACLSIALAPDGLHVVDTAEAKVKTGSYKIEYHSSAHDHWYQNFGTTYRSDYRVKILSVKKNKVTFFLESGSIRVADIVRSKPITVKLKNGKASFSYKTRANSSWKSKGKGTIKVGKNYVKVKVKETWRDSYCRLGLSTDGWLKIKKGTHKKWLN